MSEEKGIKMMTPEEHQKRLQALIEDDDSQMLAEVAVGQPIADTTKLNK